MTAALNRALAAGALRVRKVASGEAIIVFRNPVTKTDAEGGKYTVSVKPCVISSNKAVDLFARKDVDAEAIKQSNFAGLLKMGVLEVL